METMIERLARMSDEALRALERIPEGLRAWAINEAEADRERGSAEARPAAPKPAAPNGAPAQLSLRFDADAMEGEELAQAQAQIRRHLVDKRRRVAHDGKRMRSMLGKVTLQTVCALSGLCNPDEVQGVAKGLGIAVEVPTEDQCRRHARYVSADDAPRLLVAARRAARKAAGNGGETRCK